MALGHSDNNDFEESKCKHKLTKFTDLKILTKSYSVYYSSFPFLPSGMYIIKNGEKKSDQDLYPDQAIQYEHSKNLLESTDNHEWKQDLPIILKGQ